MRLCRASSCPAHLPLPLNKSFFWAVSLDWFFPNDVFIKAIKACFHWLQFDYIVRQVSKPRISLCHWVRRMLIVLQITNFFSTSSNRQYSPLWDIAVNIFNCNFLNTSVYADHAFDCMLVIFCSLSFHINIDAFSSYLIS